MIRWVCFDVGETIFDETGLWSRWAEYMGVAPGEFLAALRRIIAEGRHHREVFTHFQADFDIDKATAERLARGEDPGFHAADVFADVWPALAELTAAGVRIGVAGNTSVLTEHAIHALRLPIEFVASSSRWHVAKPEPAFFARLAEACSAPPAAIAYVGDRIDNDALAAGHAGMMGIWLRRGLWAQAQRHTALASTVRHQIDSLAELPTLLAPSR